MWCQLKMSPNKSNNSQLVWQMGLWSMKTYVPLQVLQRISVNWQSEKKNINLKGHPGYVFNIERKWHIQNTWNHTKAGQHQCAKAIAFIMVEMIQMKKGEPENWTKFAKTHFIRHSCSAWSGISACLILEQVLMWSPKSIDGLSYGRKWSEVQQYSWLLSKPTCG